MNKQDLIKAVANKTDISQKDASIAINAVFDVIAAAMADGDKVTLTGFGTFEAKMRAARTGLNPATKEKMDIPASRIPTFKAGKGLKDSVKL
ncbi:MAG: HU family DNA-binding protein [Clostridia bacterium]